MAYARIRIARIGIGDLLRLLEPQKISCHFRSEPPRQHQAQQRDAGLRILTPSSFLSEQRNNVAVGMTRAGLSADIMNFQHPLSWPRVRLSYDGQLGKQPKHAANRNESPTAMSTV